MQINLYGVSAKALYQEFAHRKDPDAGEFYEHNPAHRNLEICKNSKGSQAVLRAKRAERSVVKAVELSAGLKLKKAQELAQTQSAPPLFTITIG